MRTKCRRLGIALVSDFFCPNTGGVETHIYYLAERLMRKGHRVIVLTHCYGERRGIRYLSNGLKVYYLPMLLIGNTTLATVTASLYWFRKIFLAERIDLVHGHSAFSPLGHECAMHAWCMGLTTVFTDHSLHGFADCAAILANKFLLRYSLANVDRVICVSHTSKENTVQRAGLLPSKVFVIPNAIDAKMFVPNSEMFYSRPTTVIILSRLVYRKGADLLVEVIPRICLQHSTVLFRIYGDGPKRVELEEMREKWNLHSRVSIHGFLPHTEVRDALVQGQIFLNTSLTEAFCMAIVEAACCGLHVVSTRVGGIPEVLPSDLITLAEPNSEAEPVCTPVEQVKRSDISDALLGAIRENEKGGLRDPMEVHRLVSQFYSWDDVTKRTERVYWDAYEEHIPVKQRLRNYAAAGLCFGIFWIWGAMINLAVLAILDWWDPRQQPGRWRGDKCRSAK